MFTCFTCLHVYSAWGGGVLVDPVYIFTTLQKNPTLNQLSRLKPVVLKAGATYFSRRIVLAGGGSAQTVKPRLKAAGVLVSGLQDKENCLSTVLFVFLLCESSCLVWKTASVTVFCFFDLVMQRPPERCTLHWKHYSWQSRVFLSMARDGKVGC